jgi:hypothetical protein
MLTQYAQEPVKPQGPIPGLPKTPEQPIVPPDDPHRSIDPPQTEPPMRAPSEKPVISEPPSPRA